MSMKVVVIGTIAWAVGFVLSAIVLKGNPISDWIEGALLVGWIVFISLANWSGTKISKDLTNEMIMTFRDTILPRESSAN
jgi:hypothetical protein